MGKIELAGFLDMVRVSALPRGDPPEPELRLRIRPARSDRPPDLLHVGLATITLAVGPSKESRLQAVRVSRHTSLQKWVLLPNYRSVRNESEFVKGEVGNITQKCSGSSQFPYWKHGAKASGS